jgi:peroxiredoxin
MARASTDQLDANDIFPSMELELISGEKLKLPDGTGDGYGVVLFYRGYW